jgi:hypothetical protein
MTEVPESRLFPRLAREEARRLLTGRVGLSLAELEDLGELGHPAAAPAATGGTPATEAVIEEVQKEVRRVAVDAGYPQRLPRGREQSFDRPCASVIYQSMGIVPADAAEEGVWTFLSVVVLPEIAPWRYPNPPEERVLGRPRNVLRRLWWRAWTFGPDLDFAPEGATPLGEDEFVQVMERSSLAGSQPIARAIRRALWRAQADGIPVARSELMRELTRRVRATRSHVALEVLDDDTIDRIVGDLVPQAAASAVARLK